MAYSPRGYEPVETRNLKRSPNCHFYLNGDSRFTGSRVVISNRYKDLDKVKDELTTVLLKNSIYSGAVRNVYTPTHGHKVESLDDLKDGCHYVASLNDKFKPLNYKDIPELPRHPRKRGFEKINMRVFEPVKHARPQLRNVSARFSKPPNEYGHPIPLKVHRNGEGYNPSCHVLLEGKEKFDMEEIRKKLGDRVRLNPSGLRLWKICGPNDYRPVRNADDLQKDDHIIVLTKRETLSKENYRIDGMPKMAVTTAPANSIHYHSNPFGNLSDLSNPRSPYKYKPLPSIGGSSNNSVSPYSNPPTQRTKRQRPVKQPDYDQDESGVYRAKNQNNQRGAKQEDIRNEKTTPIPPGTELNKQPSKEQKQNADVSNQTKKEVKPNKTGENKGASGTKTDQDVGKPKVGMLPPEIEPKKVENKTDKSDKGDKPDKTAKPGAEGVKDGQVKETVDKFEDLGQNSKEAGAKSPVAKTQNEPVPVMQKELTPLALKSQDVVPNNPPLATTPPKGSLDGANNGSGGKERLDENADHQYHQHNGGFDDDMFTQDRDRSPRTNKSNEPRSSTPTYERADSFSKQQQQQQQQQEQQQHLQQLQQQQLKKQKEHEAAAKIQAGARGHKARKEYKQKKIQMQQEEEMKRQAEQQQQQQQQQQQEPAKNNGKTKEEMDAAAEKIQASFKGFKTRKDLKSKQQVRSELEKNERERKNAAIKIQSSFKGYQARKEYKHKKSEFGNQKAEEAQNKVKSQEHAATKIQSSFKGYQARKEYKHKKSELNNQKAEEAQNMVKSQEQAATKIQSSFKGYKVRKDIKNKREAEKVANKTESNIKDSNIEVDDQADKEQAASRIQAGFKGYKTRKDLVAKKRERAKTGGSEKVPESESAQNNGRMSEDEAAAKIQASFKGYNTRQKLKQEKKEPQLPDASPKEEDTDLEKAATKIQSSFRGYKARKEHKYKVNENVEDEESDVDQLPESSISHKGQGQLMQIRKGLQATAIQGCFRAYHSRKQFWKNQNLVKSAKLQIISAFEGYSARSNYRKKLEQLHNSQVQAVENLKVHFKAFKERHTKHYTLPVVNQLQAAFRGHITRKLNHIQTRAYRRVLSVDNGDYYATMIQALCQGYMTRHGVVCVRRSNTACSSARSVQGPTENEVKTEEKTYWQDTNIKMVSDKTRRLAASKLQAAYFAFLTRTNMKHTHLKVKHSKENDAALSIQHTFRAFQARKLSEGKRQTGSVCKHSEMQDKRVNSRAGSVGSERENLVERPKSSARKRDIRGKMKKEKSEREKSEKSFVSRQKSMTEDDFDYGASAKSNVRCSTTLSGTATSVKSESILNLSEVRSEDERLIHGQKIANNAHYRLSGEEVEREGESSNEIEDDVGELSSIEKNVKAVSKLQAAFRAYKVRREMSEFMSGGGELMDISKIDRAVSALKKDFKLRSNKVRRLGSYQFDKDRYEGWSQNWWEADGISDPNRAMAASVIQMCFHSYRFRRTIEQITDAVGVEKEAFHYLDKEVLNVTKTDKEKLEIIASAKIEAAFRGYKARAIDKNEKQVQKTVLNDVSTLDLQEKVGSSENVEENKNPDRVKLVRKAGSLPGYTARQEIRIGASDILNKKQARRKIEAAFRGYRARNTCNTLVPSKQRLSGKTRVKSASTDKSYHVELKSDVINDRITRLQAAFAAYQQRKVFISLTEMVTQDSHDHPGGPERMGSLSETDDFKLRHKSIAKMHALFQAKNVSIMETSHSVKNVNLTYDSGYAESERTDYFGFSRSKSGLCLERKPCVRYSEGKSKTIPLIVSRTKSGKPLTNIETYIKKKISATVLQAHAHAYLTRQKIRSKRLTEEESPDIVRASTASVKREAVRRKDLAAAKHKTKAVSHDHEDGIEDAHEMRMRTASVKLEAERRKAIAERVVREKSKGTNSTSDSAKHVQSEMAVPKAVNNMKVVSKNNTDARKEYKAATLIQKTYRGYSVRKGNTFAKQKKLDAEYESWKEKRISAAVAIQSGWRGYNARRSLSHKDQQNNPKVVKRIMSITPSDKPDEEEAEEEDEDECPPRALMIINIGRTKSEIERAEQRYQNGSMIQRVYRASKVRRKLNVKAARIRNNKREAATCLQALCKSFLVGESFKNIESVNRIHAYAHAFLCRARMVKRLKQLEIEEKARKNLAASIIQTSIRSYRKRALYAAKKEEERRNAEMNKAALDIQSSYRGFIVRRQLTEKRDRIQIKAANTIQVSIKGRRFRVQKQKLRHASLVINAAFVAYHRRKMHREKLAKEHKAATFIHASCKGKLMRKQHIKDVARRNESAVKIQSVYRGHKGRQYANHVKEVKQMNESAVKIQSVYRGHKGRQHANHVREVKQMGEAARGIIIEIMDRCLSHLKQRSEAATRIQATVEGFATRQQTRYKLDEEAREIIRMRNLAAAAIQDMFRIDSARKELERLRIYEEQCASAVKIQKIYRGYIAREKVSREKEHRLECERKAREKFSAAECIQMVVRAKQARNALQAARLQKLQNECAVTMQRIWRGYSVRKEVARQRSIIATIRPPSMSAKIRSRCRLFDDEAMSDAKAIITFHKKVTELQEAFKAYKTRREIKNRMMRKDGIEEKTPRRPYSGGGLSLEYQAATMIQKTFRGYSDRKMYGRLVRERERQRKEAATMIQASVNGYLVRLEDRRDERGVSGRQNERMRRRLRDADLIACAYRSWKGKRRKVAMRAEM